MAVKKVRMGDISPLGLEFDGRGFVFKVDEKDNRVVGSKHDDYIKGNGGNDVLIGGAGNDLITAGSGRDMMQGGSGADTFMFFGVIDAPDHIRDFSRADGDKIALGTEVIFTQLDKAGSPTKFVSGLAASNFVVGPYAKDANDHIVYDKATGALYYDADANGSGAAVQFASLKAGTTVSASDFYLF